MSTKTTIKRVALVAVAALGFGMLSVVPSNAVVSSLAVVSTDGTSTNSAEGYVSDSTTAASVTVSGLLDSADDSVTVTFIPKSRPTGGTQSVFAYFSDTTTPNGVTQVDSSTAGTVNAAFQAGQAAVRGGSETTAGRGLAVNGVAIYRVTGTAAGYVGATFLLQLDSTSARIAGTYTYTAIVKSYSNTSNIAVPTQTLVKDVSIVVPKALTASTTVDSTKTTAYINAGGTYNTSSDSAVAVVATAAATDHAIIGVRTYNNASGAAAESVTATITGPGVLCNGGVCGKNLTLTGATGSTDITVRADGTAGVASIVIATTTKTFAAKKVTFYAKAAKTAVAVVNKAVIAAASTSSVVLADLKDANGNSWAGTAYIYATSAASALVAGSETPVACSYSTTLGVNVCPVTGKTVGTATFKVIDASTVALSNVASNEVSVRVSAASAATVKLSFDKATYAPGERATIWATVVDADGKAIPTATLSNLFATGGIKSNVSLTAVSTNTLSSVSGTVADSTDTSTDSNNPTYAGAVTYVVTMPQASGDVVLTATGGTSLDIAGRVAVTATASVVNDSVTSAVDAANEATDAANAATDAANAAAEAADAATAAAQDAQAAVAALATQVSSLIAGIKAQITSLTNLVIKIQKKVKA